MARHIPLSRASTALSSSPLTSPSTSTNSNVIPGLIGGTFSALDNAPTRSIHLKIHPRPRSLNESAQILHLLRRYGEIEVYRHLKYDFSAPAPNSALVVFKYPASAAKAIAEQRVAFRYASSSSSSSFSAAPGSARPIPSGSDLEVSRHADADKDTDTVYSHTGPYPRPAELIIRPAALLHLPYIQRQRYYWPVDANQGASSGGTERPGAAILGHIPPGLQGLVDFDVMASETSFRERKFESRLWEERVRKRGWVRLDELWEMKQKERQLQRKNG